MRNLHLKSWRSLRVLLRATAACAAAASIALAALPPAASVNDPAAAQDARMALSAQLTTRLQAVVDKQVRIEGQGANVQLTARLSGRLDVLQVNLSHEYLPATYGAEMEDLLSLLATTAEDELRAQPITASKAVHVQFTIAGKDIFDYFPEDRPRASASPRKAAQR